MTDDKDTYRTILAPVEAILLKEKKSKFIGYAYPIVNEEEVKPIIELLKKEYPTANHVCYAWQLGVESISYRANDDGEPNNSAGMPIYGQIQAFDITNVLVAVIRIFGGTKLGVGGLISTYKECAKLTLEEAKVTTKILTAPLILNFDYDKMNVVMRLIKKHQLEIVKQLMEINCTITLAIKKSELAHVSKKFTPLKGIEVLIPDC
jgi:uncharacterized YigZ family protein